MLNIRTNQATKIDSVWHEFYNLYKVDITSILTKLWKQEDLFGRSNLNYRLLQYQLTFSYITLLFIEYERQIATDWNYYEEKYELSRYRKVFACNNISLDKLLELFNLPYNNEVEKQINGSGIEEDLSVQTYVPEDIEEEVVTINILGLTSTSTMALSVNTISSLCPIKCNPTVCGEECGEGTEEVYIESEDDELIETEDDELLIED